MKPIVPSAFGWSSGKTPLPRNVVATGRFRRSEKRTSASIAPSRATPGPARTTGAVAASRTSAARWTCASAGAGSTGTLTRSGTPFVSCSATSSGRIRKAAPGRSVRACLNALRTISGTASSTVIMPPHFVMGRNSSTRSTRLVGLLVEAVQAGLRGDRDERMRVEVGVRDPEHQVDRARAERGQAHARTSRERAVGVGHERRAAFVTGRDEPDRGVRERIDHVEVLLARQPEDVLDPLVLEALDEQAGNGLCAVRGFHLALRLPRVAGPLRSARWSSATW